MGYAEISSESANSSFSSHALFRVGAHMVDDRASHAIACEVVTRLKPNFQVEV